MTTTQQTSTDAPILLCTLNSTYQHTSFGLRYIYAQMGELQGQTHLLEWTIKENPRVIVEQILKLKPLIVGFGVYIWNTEETFEICTILKLVAPHIKIVLGGPEISYETETQKLYPLADFIICGEADLLFKNLCEQILSETTPDQKIIRGELPPLKELKLPYDLYSDHDIENRVIYVEVSRGCPYKCEYCLSSLDKLVRSFDLTLFLDEMTKLIQRGARTFKFVDRTFNLSPTTSTTILQFFLNHIDKNLFLHFEMVPDRLPQEIRDLIQKFPAGSLQFEVGIQTLNPQVAANVSRKNDLFKVADNFKFIKNATHVHTHADLIVGLPGETLESFASGFDQLFKMQPDEIQVGILKRLKGTPIIRHEKAFEMKYHQLPPFQILSTSTMDYLTLQKMNRFAKFWDLYANSGEFSYFIKCLSQSQKTQKINNEQTETAIPEKPPTTALHQNQFSEQIQGQSQKSESFFYVFMNFVDFLSAKFTETHSISLMNLAEQAFYFLETQPQLLAEFEFNFDERFPEFLKPYLAFNNKALHIILLDHCINVKRRDVPPFIKSRFSLDKHNNLKPQHEFVLEAEQKKKANSLTKRQSARLQV